MSFRSGGVARKSGRMRLSTMARPFFWSGIAMPAGAGTKWTAHPRSFLNASDAAICATLMTTRYASPGTAQRSMIVIEQGDRAFL
jgi:hypothetical protein